jgi:EAL domain-containing protein (putative c-di-GMP-specific phosphodiesterase class I)
VRTLLARLEAPGALRVEFQPIVRLVGERTELYCLEALTRGPRGTRLENAEHLFEQVRRRGLEVPTDLLCIGAALREARLLPGTPRVSLNVHGSTVSDPRFVDELLGRAAAQRIAPARLLLEIVEHRSLWCMQTFGRNLEWLRGAGIGIALDDLGVAASNYRMLVDCRPDHLKVDRYVVRGCSRDRYRLAVLESIVTLASGCAAVPIAEGIEDEADLALLRRLGIQHFQGWLWSRSLPATQLAAEGSLLLRCAS